MATEAKRVIHDRLHGDIPCLVGNIIQVTFWIRGFIVDGRRHFLVAQSQGADGHLDGPRSTEHMASRTFCGADTELFGVVTENGLDSRGFADVTLRR